MQCLRQVNGQEAKEHKRYHILSNPNWSAQEAGKLVRGHWSIENRLHYVLDVDFNEDRCRVREDHGAENFSRFRRLTANLLQRSPKNRSIRCKRKCCGWSKEFLVQTLFGGLTPLP